MNYTRYPEYRASGVDWLGEVPAHWEVKRLKTAALVRMSNVDKKSVEDQVSVWLCNYTDVYYNERITADMDFMEATATNEQINAFSLQRGDVLITKDSEAPDDIAVPAVVVDDLSGVLCGYHLAHIRPNSQLDGAFLAWAMRASCIAAQFHSTATGVTRFGLSRSDITDASIMLPPLDEQRAIVAFLDRETARIDALIATKRRFIALLQEKRAALISRAVMRGLDAGVPLKKSGIAWVGEIPANWVIRPLKWIADVRTGVAKGRKIEHDEAVTVPYLRVANVQDGYLDLDDVAEIEIGADELERYALRAGDVLMNEGGDNDKLGRGHVWRGEVSPCIHQNHVFAVRPQAVRSDWLALVTSSDYAKHYFLSFAKQSTNLASISSTNLKNLPVLLPPADEQAAILGFVERSLGSIDKLQALCESAIDRLIEHRASLAAFAVAGKIDTREHFKTGHLKRHPRESGDPVTSVS